MDSERRPAPHPLHARRAPRHVRDWRRPQRRGLRGGRIHCICVHRFGRSSRCRKLARAGGCSFWRGPQRCRSRCLICCPRPGMSIVISNSQRTYTYMSLVLPRLPDQCCWSYRRGGQHHRPPRLRRRRHRLRDLNNGSSIPHVLRPSPPPARSHYPPDLRYARRIAPLASSYSYRTVVSFPVP